VTGAGHMRDFELAGNSRRASWYFGRPAAHKRVKGLVWREAATQSPFEPSRTQAPLHLGIKPSGILGKRSVYLPFQRRF